MAEWELFWNEPELHALLNENGVLSQHMLDTGEEIKDYAKREIQHVVGEPPLGIPYRQNPNRSSAPGQPPMEQMGELEQSIEAYVTSSPDGGMMVMVGTDDPVGGYMEFGTDKMDARPWLRPAITHVMGDETSDLSGAEWIPGSEL